MADKAISALPTATSLTASDLFVLSQSNQAKNTTWQTIIGYLTTALDGHGGIQSIAKTSTNLLVDTYTVTLADLTTYTFTVTNAKSIQSIEKTGTSGLTDTYTITYNDGTTGTFTVTNGKGIQSIVKTPAVPPSLTDSYRINYNDGTHYDFTLTNGKAIASITDMWGVSTSASTEPSSYSTAVPTLTPTNKYLWHYLTITFNDNTTLDTDHAVSGAYGDTGEASYLHIKYAAECSGAPPLPPTDSDMSDSADDWIGICTDTNETDPTTRASYSWFRMKGDTGDPAELDNENSSVTYQAGTSGTVAPVGNWQSEIPYVAPGNYLWTRTVLAFNSGDPVTFYSVARTGIDGEGSPGSQDPLMDGTASAGSSVSYSREDHVHPTDTSRASATDVTALQTAAQNKVLYLTGIACSATTGNFVSVSNTAITANHVVAECVFANPNAITTDVTWTTGAGTLTLNGTCSAATTVNLVLVKKDN